MVENENQIKLINSKIYADYFYYDGVNTYGPGLYYFLPSDYLQRLNVIRGKLLADKKLSLDKVKEEIEELIMSVEKDTNKIHEAADVIYHLLVYLEANGIKIEDVMKELDKRKK